MESNVQEKRGNSNSLIKLNVGGHKYITTESTLNSRGVNFITTMLVNDREGKVACVRDEEGYIFIDRNGKAFSIILEYLRTGHIFLPPSGEISKEQLEIEFDFYQIHVPSTMSPTTNNVALKLYSELPESKSWTEIMETFWNANWNKMYAEIRKAVSQGNTEITFYLVYSDKPTSVYSDQYLLLPEKCREKRIVRDILKYLIRQQGLEVSTDYHMTYMRVLWNLELHTPTNTILRTLVQDSGHGYYYLNTHKS